MKFCITCAELSKCVQLIYGVNKMLYQLFSYIFLVYKDLPTNKSLKTVCDFYLFMISKHTKQKLFKRFNNTHFRLLQIPESHWTRFNPPNCSMTWISVDGNGHVRCTSFGDDAFITSSAASDS